MASVRKSYISKICQKKRKVLPSEKLGNILAFDKESKIKLLSLIATDSFIKYNLYMYINFKVEIFS